LQAGAAKAVFSYIGQFYVQIVNFSLPWRLGWSGANVNAKLELTVAIAADAGQSDKLIDYE